MLKELQVKNFAIIDDETIRFNPGLNILTGETGVGKTLIVEAINLLIGERADSSLIRDGEDRLIVQGFFDFSRPREIIEYLRSENIITEKDDPSDIVITREVNREGKNRAFINGIFTQIYVLKKIGESFIDIHGQHDHQYLLKQATHIKVLDEFGKDDIKVIKEEYRSSLSEYNVTKKELEELEEKRSKKEERLEEMKAILSEIKGMNLRTGEEEELENEKRILKNFEDIHNLVNDSICILGPSEGENASLGDRIAEVGKNLKSLSKYDEKFTGVSEEIEKLLVSVKELDKILKDYFIDLEFEPDRLDQIQSRIFNISEIKRKYDMDIDGLIEYAEKLKLQIDGFGSIDEKVSKKYEELSLLEDSLKRSAIDLSEKRKDVAGRLKASIEEEMKDLNFKNVDFRIDHYKNKDKDSGKFKFESDGIDMIEFLISLNPGENPKPLRKIASGGEISRIMLALKTIIGVVDDISTLIFDEIDTGIGGLTSFVVGKKLFRISRDYQVICITHLPQIAAFSDFHYKVEKEVQKEKTKIKVRTLNGKQKVEEISRMLSGIDESGIAYKHAEELVDKTSMEKSGLLGRGVNIGY